MNKLFGEETEMEYKMHWQGVIGKCFLFGILACPTFWSSLAFCVFGPAVRPLFSFPLFSNIPTCYQKREEKNEKNRHVVQGEKLIAHKGPLSKVPKMQFVILFSTTKSSCGESFLRHLVSKVFPLHNFEKTKI